MRDWKSEAASRQVRTYDRAQRAADRVRSLVKGLPVASVGVVCTKAGCLVQVVPKRNGGPTTLMLADLPKEIDRIPVVLAGSSAGRNQGDNMRGGKIGDDELDLIFGTSEGAAYERAVEARGDDVGFRGFSAPAPSSRSLSSRFANMSTIPEGTLSYARSTPAFVQAVQSQPPPGAPPAIHEWRPARRTSRWRATPPPGMRWQGTPPATTAATPSAPAASAAPAAPAAQAAPAAPAAPVATAAPVAVAAPAAPTVNTSWPPPRPVNLIPGAPWPPPGAAPGSDLSSFYPAGTPQASSSFWGTTQQAASPPPPPPSAAPMDVYIDNPGYSTLGMRFDSLGRAEIVDMPGRRMQAQMRKQAERNHASFMGAADHKFDVIALRAKLRRIGMDVPKNGSVDQPLADAVNGIFKGWDDAPKGLRAGDMTPQGLKTHIKLVNQLVDKAIGGAQHLENADRGI